MLFCFHIHISQSTVCYLMFNHHYWSQQRVRPISVGMLRCTSILLFFFILFLKQKTLIEILHFSSASVVSDICPLHDRNIIEFGDTCYLFVTSVRATYSAALSTCRYEINIFRFCDNLYEIRVCLSCNINLYIYSSRVYVYRYWEVYIIVTLENKSFIYFSMPVYFFPCVVKHQ